MVAMPILTAPSVLSADFADMAGAIRLIESSGGDWIHLDVMDGCFVPTITFGPKMVADIKCRTRLPLDAHLMIERPEDHVESFAKAGADHITFHVEATTHIHRLVEHVRALGAKPGLSIVPSTPVSQLEYLLPDLFQVLVMTVNPGFGGQKLIPFCLEKVRELRDMRDRMGLSFHIAVDGGVNRSTAGGLREAGANVLITGSAFFASDAPGDELVALKGSERVYSTPESVDI